MRHALQDDELMFELLMNELQISASAQYKEKLLSMVEKYDLELKQHVVDWERQNLVY